VPASLALWELDQAGVAEVWLDARRPAQNRNDIQLVDMLRVQGTLTNDLRVGFVRPRDEPLAWLPDIVPARPLQPLATATVSIVTC
jgi:hypothetical protein